jgi:tetratricopeptide (TPR) repeat protein
VAQTYSILGDSPVDSARDCLNFGRFVTPFAARLIQSVENTPFTVGILADWGQGKSTVMRMLRASLEAQGCATAWFEPWKYTGREAVWKGLALTLVREINANDSLRKELRRKKDALTTFALKALWGKLIGREWAQDLVDTVKTEPWSPSLLHDFEQNFEVLFQHIDPEGKGADAKPFVLFVDDLDRCLPESALAVLEALKLVLNRPGLITVMGIAPRELSRAVAAAYARETKDGGGQPDPKWGDNYMEKVIQMPFPLPVISDASLEAYVGTCLADSGIEPGLERDHRWRSIIREACGGNLRQVKRFLNHLIAEMDKADANEADAAGAQDLDARRVAFTLLLGWRFPEFLRLIRKQVADRELLVRYQLYFSQQAAGTAADTSMLQDPDGKFHKDAGLASFFTLCFASAEDRPAMVVPFAGGDELLPYLQFGLRSGNPTIAPSRQAAAAAPAAPSAPAAAPASVSTPSAATADMARMAYEAVARAAEAGPPSWGGTPDGPPPPAAGQPSEHVVAIIGRVQSLMSSRRMEEAKREAEAGLAMARSIQDYPGQAVLLNALGEISESVLNIPHAEQTYEQALQMARQYNSPILRTAMLNQARLARRGGKQPYAMTLATEAAEIARQAGDAIGEFTARVEVAETRAAMGDSTQAELEYRGLRQIAERLSHKPGELMVLERLARLLRVQRRDNQDVLEQASRIATALNDRRASARLVMEQCMGELRDVAINADREISTIAVPFLVRARALIKDEADRVSVQHYLKAMSHPHAEALARMLAPIE